MRQSMPIRAVLLALALSGAGACAKKPEPAKQPEEQAKATANISPAAAAPAEGEIDVCSLVSDEEIQRITGATVRSRKGGKTAHRGLRVTQCYFEMPTAAESMVVAVFQAASANGTTARAGWKEMFERDFDQEREREGGREREREEKEAARPEKIDGVGEEAFSIPQRFGAALYVLQGDKYLRLSIGGGPGDDHAKKLGTLRSVAEAMLQRM